MLTFGRPSPIIATRLLRAADDATDSGRSRHRCDATSATFGSGRRLGVKPSCSFWKQENRSKAGRLRQWERAGSSTGYRVASNEEETGLRQIDASCQFKGDRRTLWHPPRRVPTASSGVAPPHR